MAQEATAPAAVETPAPNNTEATAGAGGVADNKPTIEETMAEALALEEAENAQTGAVVETEPASQPETDEQAAAAQAQAEAEWRSLREFLPDYGIPADAFPDDATALRQMAAIYQQYQQAQPYIQAGQAVAPHWDEFQQWRASQQQAQQEQEAAAEIEPFFSPVPQFDESMLRFLKRDEQTGNIVAIPGADPTLPQKYQEWAYAREQNLNKLIANPDGYADWVMQRAQAQIDKRVADIVQSTLGQHDLNRDVRQYVQQHAPELYVFDQNGQPLGLSPKGRVFQHYAQEAAQLGLDPQVRRTYAEKMTRLAELEAEKAAGRKPAAAQQPAPAPTPQQVNQQHKQNFVQRAGAKRQPNRSGTAAAESLRNAPRQRPGAKFESDFAAALDAAGFGSN